MNYDRYPRVCGPRNTASVEIAGAARPKPECALNLSSHAPRRRAAALPPTTTYLTQRRVMPPFLTACWSSRPRLLVRHVLHTSVVGGSEKQIHNTHAAMQGRNSPAAVDDARCHCHRWQHCACCCRSACTLCVAQVPCFGRPHPAKDGASSFSSRSVA